MRQVRRHKHELDQQSMSTKCAWQCPSTFWDCSHPTLPAVFNWFWSQVPQGKEQLITDVLLSMRRGQKRSTCIFASHVIAERRSGKNLWFNYVTLVFSKANNHKTWNPYHTPTSMPQSTVRASTTCQYYGTEIRSVKENLFVWVIEWSNVEYTPCLIGNIKTRYGDPYKPHTKWQGFSRCSIVWKYHDKNIRCVLEIGRLW